jgi:uncharacterized coiled-coil protein SlyX
MTSYDDRLHKLEQKLAFLEACHREQIRFLSRRIAELQHEVDQLSSLRPDLAAVEKLVFDAHIASNGEAQDTLTEVDHILPLDIPQLFFNRLPTIREARGNF